jgi:outer membrane receptor for ferrienterochelin and colicins
MGIVAARHAAVVLCLMTGCANAALAQDAVSATTVTSSALRPRLENGRQIYDSSAFSRFAPQTANDMVRQIPGFTVTQVSSDRGLGEASQNVLINGQRISGKGDSAETVLGRTPAKSVVRLEIADGASFNISGLNGQVLNVVTKPDSFSGNFAWRPEFRRNLEPRWYNAELNISGKLGKGDYTIGINNNDSFRNGFHGRELNRSLVGNPAITRNQVATFYGDRPHIGASYARTSDGGAIFNAKASYELFRFRRTISALFEETGKAPVNELSTGSEKEWNSEQSIDYAFAALGGRLKLVGYNRFEHSPFKNLFRRDFTDGLTAATGSRFDQVVDEGESVLRSEYKWKAGKNDWQISLEGAKNFLDSDAQYYTLGSGGVFVEQPLPGANSRVEEKRGQIILSYGRPLAANLTVQTTIGGEYSKLSQTGVNGLVRSFIRPKGSASLAWKASPHLDISARLQRKVGQLNFFDFLASVDLQDANNNAGNGELVPPQSWLAEVEVNRSLGSAGSIKFQVAAEKISDIVDQIPINATQEAIGNLPSARRIRGQINASFLLDTIGWKGAKLDIEASAQKTALRDPLTGVIRPISERGLYGYSIDFRQDIPNTQWAWGAFAEYGRQSGFYRLDYQSSEGTSAPFVLAFIEYKDLFGLKVKGQLMNLANQHDHSREIFYVNRRNGPIGTIRDSRERYGVFYRLQISGTF